GCERSLGFLGGGIAKMDPCRGPHPSQGPSRGVPRPTLELLRAAPEAPRRRAVPAPPPPPVAAYSTAHLPIDGTRSQVAWDALPPPPKARRPNPHPRRPPRHPFRKLAGPPHRQLRQLPPPAMLLPKLPEPRKHRPRIRPLGRNRHEPHATKLLRARDRPKH